MYFDVVKVDTQREPILFLRKLNISVTFDALSQGWRTFFGKRAKILKTNFGKLMPCHYIKHNEFIVMKQISMKLYRMVLQRGQIQI